MSGNLRMLRDAARRARVLSNVDADGSRTRTPVDRRERFRRAAACAVVGLTGFGLLAPNVQPLLSPETPLVGVGLSLLSSAVSVGLVVAAAGLYRSEFTTRNAVRVAAWNLLGVVVLGGAMAALAESPRRPSRSK